VVKRLGQPARQGLIFLCTMAFFIALTLQALAAPYAAMVMDARTGEVLHARNADTRLHPASLTKMMTLYIVFEAVESGEISLDTVVTITSKAANEPPSKLGLRAGQQIRLRYLIRAAAVKSANDAATAIGIALEGSEAAFARRMNRTAAALGMTRTTFRNAHGLTEAGHLSTARDMTNLGRHLIYDYPQYYNLFSRRSANTSMGNVANTNRRLLAAYRGADGIKTGYTRAAGFNLVASAERGNERIIATVFGGSSTAVRNARVAELLDMGFRRAPSNATLRQPDRPDLSAVARDETIAPSTNPAPGAAGKTIRVNGLVSRSLRPQRRPIPDAPVLMVANDVINRALVEALATPDVPPETVALASANATDIQPKTRPAELLSASVAAIVATAPPAAAEPIIVTRVSTSGGRLWGINVGRYNSRYQAERTLLRVALNEMTTLDGSLRRVVPRSGRFDANFMGLNRETADLACRRLQARGTTCFMIGPS